jgi:DNA-binding IclR family transcriptional regulator
MTKSQRGIQSIEVGGALLQALVDAGAPLPLRELARRAGMSSAKAHPYLVSYGKLGLIEQDPITAHYGLGPFALQLGLVSLQLLSPVRIAIPAITALGEAVDHTVALAVLGSHGPTIVYIHESRRPHSREHARGHRHVHGQHGDRTRFLGVPAGQDCAAPHRARIEGPGGDGAGIRAAAQSELDALLAEVRERGMARAVGQPIPGINALSAPVFDQTRGIVLAVTALGPAGSFDPAWNGPIADEAASVRGRDFVAAGVQVGTARIT